MIAYSTSKLWSPRQIQRSFQLHWLALSFSLVLSRFLQIQLISTTMTTNSNQKPELVSYECKGKNKSLHTKRNVKTILFKKSTNITLILSCFTALNLHPMKSVHRKPWSLLLHRQSSCLKYTRAHTGEILFVTRLSIYPVGKFQQILLLKDYYKDQKLSLFWSLLFISSLSMLGIV